MQYIRTIMLPTNTRYNSLTLAPQCTHNAPHSPSYCVFVIQVLSESVSKALQLTSGEEAYETAHFVGMLDKFFDAVNVHNYSHGVHSRKMFQMPYTSSKDWHLKVF